jgi:hypothetical protein
MYMPEKVVNYKGRVRDLLNETFIQGVTVTANYLGYVRL